MTTAAPQSGWQASAENAFAASSGTWAPSDMLVGAGLLGGGALYSHQQMVLDSETFSWTANGGRTIGTGSSVKFDTSDLAPGRYRLKAAGATASGETVYSDPIEVDIERGDKPKKLESEWQSVTLAEQEDTPLQVWGVFPDGSKIDVTRSVRAAYTSDRPTVAAVTKEGAISGVAAGKARITVKYDDKIVVVPVVVTPNGAGAKQARR